MNILANKQIPLMGFGTFIGLENKRIEDEEERSLVVEQCAFRALQAGCRHIDCAERYGNLESIGNALQKAFLPLSKGGLGLTREDIWITSKDIAPSAYALHSTLTALKISYLDLYLIHWPNLSMLETLWAEMNDCIKEGFVKHIAESLCCRYLEGIIQ